MRTRIRLPIAVLGTLVILLALAAPAFAQEGDTEFADEAAEECHKLLEEGKTVDDCQEAPNPLHARRANEIIWGGAGVRRPARRDVEVGSPRGART